MSKNSRKQREISYKNGSLQFNVKNPSKEDMEWTRKERQIAWVYKFVSLGILAAALSFGLHKLDKLKQVISWFCDK
jgi:hypothetical protein